MKQLFLAIFGLSMLTACQQYEKTPTGLPYQLKKGDGKIKPKHGQFIKFNVEFKIGTKDSVLNSSYGHVPAFATFDTARLGKYSFMEIIPAMHVGDKATFSMSVDTVKNMGMINQYDNVFVKGDFIKGRLELLSVFNTEAEVNADYQNEMKLEKEREIEALKKYISKKNINLNATQKSKEGVIVYLKEAGNTTLKADSGKQLTVLYKGYTEEGKVFDANMGTEARTKEPLKLVLGTNSVIAGWEEGLKFFNKGAKGTIFVPAMLA
ncbi:MAG: FKBP-type peptidyl-prolyl cis-trans isomerase, partial [Chitinophagaceae bacterium]